MTSQRADKANSSEATRTADAPKWLRVLHFQGAARWEIKINVIDLQHIVNKQKDT